ncbi:MAG TPA: ADYC domain-containing protein [Polyangia bacterium]|jgi:hypothetical protein|nr:ADYC domain-containing protein [Polyangia bacterium]
MSWPARLLLVLLTASFPGCDAQPVERSQGGLRSSNGMHLNGMHLNGMHLNGMHLNGMHLNGMHLNGTQLSGVRLEGTTLLAVREDGSTLSGAQLVGSELSGVLSDGSTLPLRIDAVGFAPAPNDDLYAYQVSYASPDGSGWQPLCGVDEAGAPVAAFPLSGLWDEREGVPGGGSHTSDPDWFTFACRGAAIAKCVEWGYRPWERVLGCKGGNCAAVSLEPYHQACTRMVRADYCGDGEPWTVDGRAINIFDGLGIQTDTESWTFEAEWGPGGARCLTRDRVLQLEVELEPLGIKVLPDCILARVDATCGDRSHFDSGSLLMNEFQTQYVGLSIRLLSH